MTSSPDTIPTTQPVPAEAGSAAAPAAADQQGEARQTDLAGASAGFVMLAPDDSLGVCGPDGRCS